MPNEKFSIVIISILAAVGMFLLIEPRNLGFSPDSMAYLEMAENFSEGRGITNKEGEVIDHWPPAFPIAISLAADISDYEILEAGKILQPFLFFLFVLLYFLVLRQLQLSNTTIFLSGFLVITSQLVKNFLLFLSEGLFFVLLLLSFYWFLKWLSKREKRYLIFTGISCGFLFLSRYAAVGFIGAYILYFLYTLYSDGLKFKDSFKQVIYFIIPIVLIVLPWFLYLASFDENPNGRELAVHVISLSKLGDFFITIAFWFLGSVTARIALLLLALFYLYCFIVGGGPSLLILSKTLMSHRRIIIISLLMITVYPLFLIFSISFYDSWTPLDNRILSPIFPFILLLITLVLEVLYEQKRKLLFFSTVLVLLLSFTSSVIPSYINYYKNGGGYNKVIWRNSDLIKFLVAHTDTLTVYSNGVEFGVLHAGRDFKLLPLKSKEREIKEVVQEVKVGKAQIVYFKNVNWRNYLITGDKLLKELDGLETVYFEDGFIIRKSTSE